MGSKRTPSQVGRDNLAKSWSDPVQVYRSVPDWLDELDRMESACPDPVRLLGVRRYGKSGPGQWWVHMRARTLLMLVVPLLGQRGYGEAA